MKNTLTSNRWKKLKAEQQPDWGNKENYNKVIQEITKYPPLVFAGEVQALKQYLGEAAQGRGFLIQGGDCAETFNKFQADTIRDKLKTTHMGKSAPFAKPQSKTDKNAHFAIIHYAGVVSYNVTASGILPISHIFL